MNRYLLGLVVMCLLLLTASPLARARPQVGVTAGLEFPHILTGQIDLIYNSRWTLGFNLGGMAYTFNSASASPIPLSMAAGNVHIRWAPFNGTFFLALAGGAQKVGASGSRTFTVTDATSGTSASVPASASVNVTSPFITPHLGWFVSTRWGITFGLEAGLQIPFSSSSAIDVEITDPAQSQYLALIQASAQYQDLENTLETQIGTFANIILPYAALRLGWTF